VNHRGRSAERPSRLCRTLIPIGGGKADRELRLFIWYRTDLRAEPLSAPSFDHDLSEGVSLDQHLLRLIDRRALDG
jgi:hypothetical protein